MKKLKIFIQNIFIFCLLNSQSRDVNCLNCFIFCLCDFLGVIILFWKCKGQEMLFVSKKVVFDNKKVIRGGISFVFRKFYFLVVYFIN